MKKSIAGILVLGFFLGYSGPVWAQSFPVNFSANFADQSTNTLVKVEGNELRVSVNSLQGDSIQDYLMDVEQGTIAQSSGEKVTRGGDGWQAAYNAILSSLTSVKSGLTESGDAVNADALGTTLTFLADWA